MTYMTPFEKYQHENKKDNFDDSIKRKEEIRSRVPDWSEIKHKNKRSSTPSYLYTWYFQELRKKEAGKYNELDEARIKTALNGFKNEWSSKVAAYPEKFTGNKFDKQWNEIKQLS